MTDDANGGTEEDPKLQRDFGKKVPRSSTWGMMVAEMATTDLAARAGAGIEYQQSTQNATFVLCGAAANTDSARCTEGFVRDMLRRSYKGKSVTVDVPASVQKELSDKLFRPYVALLRMEFGLSDAQYQRFGKLFLELTEGLTPAAHDVIRLFAGNTGNKMQPFEALYLAKAREEASIPGLKAATLESPDCGGVSWFARGPGAIVDPLFALADNAFGFIRMVTAGILTPEHIPTAVHFTSTDPGLLASLVTAGDHHSKPAGGWSAIAGLLARRGLLAGDAKAVLKKIGNARWSVDAATGAKAATAHVTVMYGPCPFHWYGCPERQREDENPFEAAIRGRLEAGDGYEAKLVRETLELDTDASFNSYPWFDLGLYLYVDKATEILSAGIDGISGTTRGFLGSANTGWLSLSPRYLRQVPSSFW